MLMKRLNAAKERVDKALIELNLSELTICLKKFRNIYTECHELGEGTPEYHYAEHIKFLIYGGLFAELDYEGEFFEMKQRADTELWKCGKRPNKFTNKYINHNSMNIPECLSE